MSWLITTSSASRSQWWITTVGSRNYDISPDGETFMLIERTEEFSPTRVEVVLNWFEELKRLVPVD